MAPQVDGMTDRPADYKIKVRALKTLKDVLK